MNKKTEKDIVLYYLNNLVKNPLDSELEDRICDWFENHSSQLIGYEVDDLWKKRYSYQRQGENKDFLHRCCKTIRAFLKGKAGRLPEMLEINAIIKAFHLPPEYHDVLRLHVFATVIPALTALTDSHRRSRDEQRILAHMLDVPWERYRKFFSPASELVQKGLFGGRNDNDDMTSLLNDVLMSNCKTPEAVKKIILGKPQKTTLKSEHFEHIREEYHWLRNLLNNAVTKKQRGVNILIYGKPGVGKNEIAMTLCKEIGASLYAVSGNITDERNGIGRRSDLAAALCLLKDDQNSVLLMDEAEDVFGASRNSFFFGGEGYESNNSKSKLFFNKLLESNNVPVIWISNCINGVDPAHLRRFSYALKMEAPNESVQHRIWDYTARKNKIKLPRAKIEKLVKTYDIAPGIIDASLKTAALTGDHEAIEKTIDSLQTAMHGRSEKREFIMENEFSTDLLNCDTDLEKLSERILELKGMNFSLCLYGVSGSGKSAYARFLAEKMKMKVLQKRASDLISKWVGESEQNISAAFAEAKRKKMLLVFDEVDSFLQDRRFALRNWEVTQVNEMLTQMESHPLPFICTTNLMEDLDQASLRRFTFKVKYDYLTQKQIAQAFGAVPK